MASYQQAVDKDIELLRGLHEYCQATPRLRSFLEAVVSPHPLKDITLVIWITCLFGVLEIGRSHFWTVALNLIFVVALRRLLEVKRPYEFDPDLQPLTDTNPEVYAFPSLESYMSVVVFGHIIASTRSLVLLALFVVLGALVGFSRIYSRSRFPHQIVASWVLGVFGLGLTPVVIEYLQLHQMAKMEHGSAVGFVLVGAVCHFAISMENNDSRLLGVRKEEFKRVMRDIMNGGDGGTQVRNGDADADDVDGGGDARMQMPASPRTLAVQAALANTAGATKKRVKHDSFYFLHKALDERSSQAKPPSEASGERLSRLAPRRSSAARRSQLVVDAEDQTFHDSYSEASSEHLPEGLLRAKLV